MISWGMKSRLIVIIQCIDRRKNHFASRTATNLSLFSLDHIYSSTIVVDASKGEGEKAFHSCHV